MDIEYDDLQPGVSHDERGRGLKRVVQVVFGILLIVAGVVMLVVPGPGLVAIMVGLNLIKPDNFLVRWMRRQIPGIPEDGKVPTRYLVLGGVLLVAGTAVGILYGPALTDLGLGLIGIR